MVDMFNSESYGTELPNPKHNGYFIGKQWMGVTVSMWKEDISKGYLRRTELYDDPRLPHWWLDKILKDY